MKHKSIVALLTVIAALLAGNIVVSLSGPAHAQKTIPKQPQPSQREPGAGAKPVSIAAAWQASSGGYPGSMHVYVLYDDGFVRRDPPAGRVP